MISRKINWVSSIDERNKPAIKHLESQLSAFYATNPDYYSKIDFTADNWIDPNEIGYTEIVRAAQQSLNICEVGCGSANILKHHPDIQSVYTGCDFSADLMRNNKVLYPQANFSALREPNRLPFDDAAFDFVFSVFVLEHSTDPSKLLDECARILKPHGKLMILCPDFLSQGMMSSQRAGWSQGTTSQKLKQGKWLDALVTFYDNRIRIPNFCKKKAAFASCAPVFLVNLTPTVFTDNFIPDVDAVYITFKGEIRDYLKNRFTIIENTNQLSFYEIHKYLIFLSLQKK